MSLKRNTALLCLFLALAMIVSSCTPQATPTASAPTDAAPATPPTTAPTTAPAANTQPTAVPPQPTAVVQTGPQVGGTFVYAISEQPPDTLDIQKSISAVTSAVTNFIGGSLIARDLDGKFIPYLAESWTASADGLSWEFKLRKDVKFHNGEPLKAQDWVYTIERTKADEMKTGASAFLWSPVTKAEAVDDYTLKLTLKEPNFPFLFNLTAASYMMPYNQKAVEAGGDNYGRAPVGVGPFKFKEWVTDQKIVLERNPDYNWGPKTFEGANTGASYIQTIEFRILPEYQTVLAGLEAGDLQYAALQVPDVDRIKSTGKFDIEEQLSISPTFACLDNETKPFDDLKVRKALNMATDRQSIIKVIGKGYAVEIHGPLTPAIQGYWPDVEKFGYGYDLEQAKQLMADAGYTLGSDGILVKDGKPFKITIKVTPSAPYNNIAQVLKEQWKALGVDVTIEQLEWGVLSKSFAQGNFDVIVSGAGWGDADLMAVLYLSSQIGTLNCARVKDAALDELLQKTRTSTDPAARQEAVNQAQKYIAENAYMVPLIATMNISAMSKDVVDVKYSKVTGLNLQNAYFTK